MNRPLALSFASAALILGVGCASGNSGGSAATTPATTCIATTTTSCLGTTSGVTTTTGTTAAALSGSTATLTTTTSLLSQMFFNSNPNNPQNIVINIDFTRAASTIIVQYTDGGNTVQAAFGTVHPYSGYSSNEYNGFVNQSGTNMYKGFFQDEYGAVILIVDHFISQGDGQAGNIASGSLWFQNFNRYAPNNTQQGPLKMCWEISLGPYDCRSFLVSNSVSMMSSYYPNNYGPNANMAYQQLGTFTGSSGARPASKRAARF